MAKGKDVKVVVILECTGCVQNGLNKESQGISRYITQKNRHNTPSQLDLKKILPFLLQTYNSWRDKEINRTEGVYHSSKEAEEITYTYITYTN